MLTELKKFPSNTDKKYLIDLTWLKLSLFDDDNIYASLKKVAPEFEKKSPKHQKSTSNLNFSQPALSINREEKKKNQENISNSMNNQENDRYSFEISHEKKEDSFEKPIEKFTTNPLQKSKSANMFGEYKKSNDWVDEEEPDEIKKKQSLLHDILRESCVLEEDHFLKKSEKDLVHMSFYLENKVEEINPIPDQSSEKNDEVTGLNSYRHNTFINSIKMLENNNSKDSIVVEDDKKLNELLRAITHYKVLTGEIEKHLNDPKMVLCNLKERYVDYYINKYDEIIEEKEQFVGRDDLYERAIDEAFEDLKQFIEIFHQAIYYFYKIQYLDQKILIEKSFFKPENIHNFLTSILMDRKIYSILYLSLIQSQENKEDSLRLALQFCHQLQPKDFEITAKYCLDQSTIDFHSKIKFQSGSSLTLKGLNQESDKGDQTSNLKKTPYETAIKCLKEIEFVRSPLHKLKVLVKTGDEILQSIEEFYKSHELEYSRDSLCADDLLPIFTYVVAKSQVKCFYSQIKIIDELASRNLKNTLSGYYFVTLQIALNLIERCFQNDGKIMENNKEENIKRKSVQEVPAKASFTENMSAKLCEIKEINGPKKSIFNIIKDNI